MKKLTYSILITLSLTISCNSDKKDGEVKDVSSGNELLSADVNIGEMAVYPEIAENESTAIERSFENSPPLIPHTVKGMYNITGKKNECLLCHLPNNKKGTKGKSVPVSHFTDYRPEIQLVGELYEVQAKENEVVAVSTGTTLNKAMYNCNLCHAPQADITVEIKNLFTPYFRNSDSKKSSNLDETMNEGVN